MHKQAGLIHHPIKGIIFAILAFFSFAVMNMFAKLLGDSYHPIELTFWRNVIGTILIGGFILYTAQYQLFRVKNPIAVGARSVFGTISLIFTLATFIALPMADATAFVFTSVLFVPILAFFFLSEKVGRFRIFAIIVGFIGIIVMVNPTGNVNTLGVFLGLSTAMLHAILQVILRHIGKSDLPLTTIFYFVGGGMLLTAPFMPFFGKIPNLADLPFLLGLAVAGTAGQVFITNALRFAETSTVSIFNYSGIIWATAFGWFIWGDWPAPTIWIGGTIVIACNIFIVWREAKIRKSEKALL